MLNILIVDDDVARDNMCGGYRMTGQACERDLGHGGISMVIDAAQPDPRLRFGDEDASAGAAAQIGLLSPHDIHLPDAGCCAARAVVRAAHVS